MTAKYWNERYKSGLGAGAGSRGRLYEFKLKTVQQFVDDLKVGSVLDLGCGDGSQLMSLNVKSYLGYDISDVAIDSASILATEARVYSKMTERAAARRSIADMAISLDVLLHLDEAAAKSHIKLLFHLAKRYVLIYAPNRTGEGIRLAGHMHFWEFVPHIKEEYGLDPGVVVKNDYPVTGGNPTGNTSYCDFYLFDMKQDKGGEVEKEN